MDGGKDVLHWPPPQCGGESQEGQTAFLFALRLYFLVSNKHIYLSTSSTFTVEYLSAGDVHLAF